MESAVLQSAPESTPIGATSPDVPWIARARAEAASGLRTLNPAYFAIVMATGIVAIAAYWAGIPVLPNLLAWTNLGFFACLVLLTLARVVYFPRSVLQDISDHKRGPGFFSVVAATCVLGRQMMTIYGESKFAAVLWLVAVPLLVVLTYTIFTALTIKEDKPTLDAGIHGGWLILVVAMQAVSGLGSSLVPQLHQHQQLIQFFALATWLCGGMLYIWLISLIFYRYTFFRFSPSDLMPPYWINMGAMAISTLAGTALIRNAPHSPFLLSILPFLKGFTVFFWATASWWIPMLVILALWRHVYKRFPLTYDPLYWGAVFPLGMYTVATHELAAVAQLNALLWIPRLFVYAALAAWVATFAGLVLSLYRKFAAVKGQELASDRSIPMKTQAASGSSSFVPPSGNRTQLILGTGAFALCFAVFGSVSAMMPIMRKLLALDPMQVSVALAVPVLLGSLGRIPLGMLTDRFGGRKVFSVVMAASVVPALLIGDARKYDEVLALGFLIGIALASFAVGVGFVSGWYPAERQGTALGIYGAGNAGQSLAAFGAPLLAGVFGYAWGFRTFAWLLLLWLIVFLLLARNAPQRGSPKTFRQMVRPLADRRSWKLSLYYFLTFGGFVAMAIYLPLLLTELFGLTPADAGLRTAGFIILATVARPAGGWLADRVGGRRVLSVVFPWLAAMAVLLTFPEMVPFTVGALGMAAGIGLGNGAVFKLVPEYFPNSVGGVTGLVGAAGGLGGFFPPLVLGAVLRLTGTYTLGFVFLSLFAVLCWLTVRPRIAALCLTPPEPGTAAPPCSKAAWCRYAGQCFSQQAKLAQVQAS